MGVKRVVDVGFWTDEKVVDYFSPEDKYFMLYILTNPHTTQLGIYPLSTKVAAFEMGYSQEAVTVLLERFQNKYKILKWSRETGEIAIKNYLLHSIIKGGKPVYDCLMREYKGVKNKALLNYVWQNVKGKANETVLSFFEDININNNENDNENENENENEVSYYDTLYDSYNDTTEPPKKKKTAPTRHKYGQYENVLLSDDDMEKLKNEFPYDWQQRIERLSEYIASSGKSYKNHLATIRSWARKDKPQQRKPYNDKPIPEPEPVQRLSDEEAARKKAEMLAQLENIKWEA